MPDSDLAASEDPRVLRTREALHDLYFLSLTDEQREAVRDALGFTRTPDLKDIADVLQDAPVHLVLRLHAVASALNRRPALALTKDASAEHLARALHVGPPPPPDSPSVKSVAERLQDFAMERQGLREDESEDLTPDVWARFLATMGLDERTIEERAT
jgi:hypothetical protein